MKWNKSLEAYLLLMHVSNCTALAWATVRNFVEKYEEAGIIWDRGGAHHHKKKQMKEIQKFLSAQKQTQSVDTSSKKKSVIQVFMKGR